jgi:hypothetical protein
MTEYEAVSLFFQISSESNQSVFGYVSILSAFLVMSYFAATKISKWLSCIILLLFSFVCFLIIIQINLARNDMANLYSYIFELKGGGALSLIWFGNNPQWAVGAITTLITGITLGGYIGCVAFFFYKRLHKSA